MRGAFWAGAHAAAWTVGYLSVALTVALLAVGLVLAGRRIRFRHQVAASARRHRPNPAEHRRRATRTRDAVTRLFTEQP